MTWLIAIDEAGDLGSCSQYFVMSAIVTKRVNTLKPEIKMIPIKSTESKFCNTKEKEIMGILKKLSVADIYIFNIEVNKCDYKSTFYKLHGNKLYRAVMLKLLDNVFKFIGNHDTNLFIDRSTFIGLNELRLISNEISTSYGCNLKRCEKATSHQNRCIQIADFIVGSFFINLEHEDDRFKTIVEEKVIPAPKY